MHQKEIEAQITKYLKGQGYQVTARAKLNGKSGIEHTFDVLAQKDDGFTSYTLAICIATGGDREKEASTIFNFANKAYDAGIKDRILIAIPRLDAEAKQLAEKQRIRVIDEEQLAQLLAQEPRQPIRLDKSSKFETKAQLLESLASLGYRVEEKAKVQGKSGVEYTFDILAYSNGAQISRSLAIDIITGEKKIGLEQIALFDAKTYDAGIDDKIMAVATGLSPEAEQFAQHQGIKVLELGTKPAPSAPVTEAKQAKPETPPAKPLAKLLRQMPQPEALKLIPEVVARRYNAIPLTITGNTLEVAMADPTDILALETLSALSRRRIKPIAASAREVREAIDFNYKGYGEIEKQVSLIAVSSETTDNQLAIDAAIDAPLAQALELIIEEAGNLLI